MSTWYRSSWMWAEACALLTKPVWEPPANIFSRGPDVLVMVALPGARADEISVQLTPTGLSVETDVPVPPFDAAMQLLRLEIPYGRMRRLIELPPGRYALAERRLDRGWLFLTLQGAA